MKRINCIVGLIAFCAYAAYGSASAGPPNIVLILADDVGREVLGCYGGTSYHTPNIDRLANDGMRFEHAYVMPVCHPTRTTLLTGRYPFRLGHPEWGTFPRQEERRTLPALLRQAGYCGAVAGKWQLALLREDLEQPSRMGFDEYSLLGWHEGPWYYQPHIWQNGERRRDVRARYGPDVNCEFIIDFIERDQKQPFFAFYSMSLCHAETNDLERPAPVGPIGRYDSYAEMVEKMDEQVGRIVETIDRRGLRENTLLVFFSDNGTAARNLIDAEGDKYMYEPVVSKMGDREILGGKGTLTDWGTRVPLIARWPATIKPGEVTTDLIDASDMMPSLVDVAGGSLPAELKLDGSSFMAQMRDRAPPRRWVFAEHRDQCFVRNQRWKLYRDGRLFDMEADPDEQRSLPNEGLPLAATLARNELQRALDGLKYQPPD
jgi:arylsulfatase A-like enzyme